MKREFYICDDKLYCMTDGRSEEITEQSTGLIEEILARMETFYPLALKALNEEYSRSKANVRYYNFLRVRRFLKCNFGDLDTSDHDDKDGVFSFEKIHCPLRGECRNEGLICMPEFSSSLSEAEKRVMKLFYDSDNIEGIADKLYLSGHTVRNHIKASYLKLGVHSRGEFIRYASKFGLFK